MNRDVLTRKEVIEAWQKNRALMERFCCPVCRDILVFQKGYYSCENLECNNHDKYYETGVKIK